MAIDDAFTVALLHMDTTFTDESGKTWTANGNAQIDTAQSKFGGASGLFDGTGDYVSSADHADWILDGGSDANQWTIDFWVRFASDPGTGIIGFWQQVQDTSNFFGFRLDNNNLNFRVRSGGSDVVDISNAFDPASGTWYHLAIVKQGTTGYKIFVDGTQVGTTQTDVSTLPNLTGEFRIGIFTNQTPVDYYLNGWMEEVRISKGIARWTGNFTPPTSAYGLRKSGQRIFVLGL
jgi:hypothetical protein